MNNTTDIFKISVYQIQASGFNQHRILWQELHHINYRQVKMKKTIDKYLQLIEEINIVMPTEEFTWTPL